MSSYRVLQRKKILSFGKSGALMDQTLKIISQKDKTGSASSNIADSPVYLDRYTLLMPAIHIFAVRIPKSHLEFVTCLSAFFFQLLY